MIGLASDHGGYETKEELIKFLEKNGYKTRDYGTFNNESTNYPDYAFKLANNVVNKEVEKGILICTTGIGMSIAANKVKGIRCAKIDTIEEAKLCREHNDCNMLAIGAITNLETNKQIAKIFLDTVFSNQERHIYRINQIAEYEGK
ncbi:MAG: RpiB/LacA/LacB family sugar-phosphate isomerase [Bacilli bacterium]